MHNSASVTLLIICVLYTGEQKFAIIDIKIFSQFSVSTTCNQILSLLSKCAHLCYYTGFLLQHRKVLMDMVPQACGRYLMRREERMHEHSKLCSAIFAETEQSASGFSYFTTSLTDAKGHSIEIRHIGTLDLWINKHKLSPSTLINELKSVASLVFATIDCFIS